MNPATNFGRNCYLALLWMVFLISLGALGFGITTLIGHGIFPWTWDSVTFPWTLDGFKRFSICSILVLSVLWLVASRLPAQLNKVALGFAVLFSLGAMGTAPLVVAWIGLSSFFVGRLLTEKALCLHAAERIHPALELLVGLGFYATIIGLAAHFKINYQLIYVVLLALPIPFSGKTIKQIVDNIANALSQQAKPAHPYLAGFAWYLVVIYLITSAIPEIGWDALAMHLMIPAYVAQNHVWSFDVEHYVWAVFPMNGDWLFSLAYMLAGEYGARLLNVGLMALIAWLLWSFVAHAGKRYSLVAVILLLSLPLSYLETGSLFVENAWAAFLFGAFLALVRYIETNQRSMLVVTGMLAGFALATKLTTALMLPWFALVLGWHIFRTRRARQDATYLAAASLGAVALGSIPYVFAYMKTGNPVFPLYNAIFKSAYYDSTSNFTQPIFEHGLSADLLYSLTFESTKYLEGTAGSIGFYFLVLFPAALIAGLASRDKTIWLTVIVSLGFFLAVFFKASYLRYIFPAVPMFIAVMVLAASQLQNPGTRLVTALRVATTCLVGLGLIFFNAANWNHRDFQARVGFENTLRDEYIITHSPIRSAVQYLNSLPSPPTSVAFFGQPAIAGLHATALMNNWYNTQFALAVAGARDPSSLASAVHEHGASIIVMDDNMADKKLHSMLQEISHPLEKFGYVSVSSLRGEYTYHSELLTNPDLTSQDGWSPAAGARYQTELGTFLVSIENPITQAVRVTGGGRYLLEVTARCQSKGEFRLQVNWLDDASKFIRADIDVAECTDKFTTRAKEVAAPDSAQVGIVYGVSHDSAAVEIKRISFRK